MLEVDVSSPTFTQGERGAAKDHGSQQIIIITTKL